MQARAIFEAACNVQKEGIKVEPEIMIPLVGFLPELKAQAKIVHDTAKKVFAEKGVKVKYLVGTMIELPRACVVADQIAKEAQFFSFGTNDLTQTGLGMSRDDYGSFIRHYLENDLVPQGPVPDDRLRRRRRPDEDRRREGPGDARRPEDRHLRRARRRPGLGQVLPQDRAELRELQPVPRADRPAGGGAGGAGEEVSVFHRTCFSTSLVFGGLRMFEIRFSEDAQRHLKALTARDRRTVVEAIEHQLLHKPMIRTRNRKMLRANPLATWELRSGAISSAV